MKNNYFRSFHKKMERLDLRGAKRMLKKGLQAYMDHLNQMVAGGIDGEEAGLMLAAMRPLVKTLENLDGAAAAEELITKLYPLGVVCFSSTNEQEDAE